ncbi:protein GAMETE EXPRESSED 1 [Cornus florida]|uniref:protein GAMETE EXPRESSED 1 n=1 Tax=Cornus florida TaxID=4283 RepID=UPI00289B2D67|nr:protein GAMETE EXPRESSED 1 [Cornus florida]
MLLVIEQIGYITVSKATQMGHLRLLFLWILVLFSQSGQSWGWGWAFSSKESDSFKNPPENAQIYTDAVAEFSMEPLTSRKAKELVEKAETMSVGLSSCRRTAYQRLFASCSDILADQEKQSRLAWHLSDCFQKDTGRPPFPYCDTKSRMVNCLEHLNGDAHKVYLEFYLETNSICHQLQAGAFKHETERLVNELKKSAQFAEDKLENIEEKAEHLLQSSDNIQNSLDSIDLLTQQVTQSSKNVEDHVSTVLKHSEAVYKQSEGIAAAQTKLSEGQEIMREKLDEGMSMLHDSYDNLGREIDNLKNETVEIEKEIGRVGDQMSSKMKTLESKADDIGAMAGSSLEKQKQLLDGQSVALEGLESLTKFQSEALEESRGTLQWLAEFGHRQQEELLRRQQQLQRAHDHLVENTKSMLAAQEAFESKQASMFVTIEKILALLNTMLLESRFFRALFVYSISIFILYVFTSTKQTYNVRPRLYIGLCATFAIELAILRYATYGIERQTWMVSLVRLLFVLLASVQLLHAIYTYRDYEALNHQMLRTLIEKVNDMQSKRDELWDVDSDVSWSSWIDTELPEDMNIVEDPDYLLPDYLLPEEVRENSVATSLITRRYDLRPRRHNL